MLATIMTVLYVVKLCSHRVIRDVPGFRQLPPSPVEIWRGRLDTFSDDFPVHYYLAALTMQTKFQLPPP